MKTILLINNYSMENAYSLWKRGVSGSHHVWGKVELDQRGNFQMEIFPHVKYPFLNKVGKWMGIGHLDQQIRVLLYQKNFDILYTPYATANTKLLLLLKSVGLFKKPIVATVHQALLGTRSKNAWYRKFTKKMILQYDASIFLSRALMEDTVNSLNIPQAEAKEKFSSSDWGPDTQFYTKFRSSTTPSLKNHNYVISAGHTDRDYETLIEAFRHIDFRLKIYCTPSSTPKVSNLPQNVEINTKPIPYIELLDKYKDAMAIMIPLKYSKEMEGCQGMTSLQDVVALSKPVIMTENKKLNIDIEREGLGYWVQMGDVEGWRRAFEKLAQDEAGWHRMCENAVKVYQEKFNSTLFANDLEQVFFKVSKKLDNKAESHHSVHHR